MAILVGMKKTKVVELNSDKDLVERVKKGNIEAFDILFMKYSQRLYHFSLGYLKSGVDAEDMTQEVFVQLWENRDKLDPQYSFNSYIFTITKNKILNVIRKRVYENKYLDTVSVKQILPDFTTDNQMDFKELLEISQEAIESLPPKRKQIFKMSRNEGLTYEEIAVQLGISKKTVENQMGTALKTLRSYLTKNAEIHFSLLLLLGVGY